MLNIYLEVYVNIMKFDNSGKLMTFDYVIHCVNGEVYEKYIIKAEC